MPRPTSRLVAEAAAWAAELDAGALDAEQQADLDAWRARDPRHGLVLQRMRGLDAGLAGLEPTMASALKRMFARTGKVPATGRILGVAAAIVLAGGLFATQTHEVRERFAGLVTETGEQRDVILADGSRLRLDTATAADTSGRRVRLYRGQVFAQVAPDGARPFVVQTRYGSATALGTAYAVRVGETAMTVAVTESRVRVCAGPGAPCETLGPGDRAQVRDRKVVRLAPVAADQAAGWASGWLEADDLPVAEVLNEIGRYRREAIVFDASALEGIRVTGGFPLTQPERALRALAGATGLRLREGDDGTVHIERP